MAEVLKAPLLTVYFVGGPMDREVRRFDRHKVETGRIYAAKPLEWYRGEYDPKEALITVYKVIPPHENAQYGYWPGVTVAVAEDVGGGSWR